MNVIWEKKTWGQINILRLQYTILNAFEKKINSSNYSCKIDYPYGWAL